MLKTNPHPDNVEQEIARTASRSAAVSISTASEAQESEKGPQLLN